MLTQEYKFGSADVRSTRLSNTTMQACWTNRTSGQSMHDPFGMNPECIFSLQIENSGIRREYHTTKNTITYRCMGVSRWSKLRFLLQLASPVLDETIQHSLDYFIHELELWPSSQFLTSGATLCSATLTAVEAWHMLRKAASVDHCAGQITAQRSGITKTYT